MCAMRWPRVIKPRACHQRHLFAAGLHPHLRRCKRGARSGREGEKGFQDGRQDLQSASSMGSTSCPSSPARRTNPPRLRLRLLERRRRLHGDAHGDGSRSSLPSSAVRGLDVWREPLSLMRLPEIASISAPNPFERAGREFQVRRLVPREHSSSNTWRHHSSWSGSQKFQGFPAPAPRLRASQSIRL